MSFIINPYQVQPSVPSYGTLTTAWITATGETDTTILGALNTLESDLSTYGLTSKMKALYPFVGGTSTKHKYNFMDARDLDAAFRLVFSGGWTHSSTGALPNGTNAYANTYLYPAITLSSSSAHFSKYNRNNDLTGTQVDGCYDGGFGYVMQQNYTAANGIIGTVPSLVSYTQTDTRGLFTSTRTATNAFKAFKNSTSQGSNTTTITALPNVNFYIGARTDGFYNSYECAFASLGDGLSDSDVSNLYTAVQAFQTTLGRNV